MQLSGIGNYVLRSFGGKIKFSKFYIGKKRRGPENLLWFHSKTWTMQNASWKTFGLQVKLEWHMVEETLWLWHKGKSHEILVFIARAVKNCE